MEKSKKLARANWKGSGDKSLEEKWFKVREQLNPTEFLGYEFDKLEGVILKISKGKDFVEEAKIGDEVEIVTNQTPFYAESGGQVGDQGVIYSNDCKVVIEDTQKKMGDLYVHFGKINKGSYDKLSLKGKFSENEIVEITIYQVDKDKKILQVISDRARPFVKNFDFIKGFEGGKLEYESVISKEASNSNLIITNFKVSKVPALAKLLTLASLQGIADTLSGEGIRFESFEMKSNSKGNLLDIEESLALGPAVSILFEGYVDKGKIVSLRGTLIPARTVNKVIGWIPLVGKILVGNKVGEGVFGVSFKMKGPPKDIKTTVNPIKTLTPRFITRMLEKMKDMKYKNEETK